MAEYSKEEIKRIEDKWQKKWDKDHVYQTLEDPNKPKYYVLDMFPYPSGAGLHVGHPLGYIASDIVARYKRIKGFNVLHPMGFDAFGLPAEQYAIQTGQHPAVTTSANIETYKRQLRQIGFSFDWSREVQTSDPNYYKWTQWIFMQLFNSFYNTSSDKTEPISNLIQELEKNGNKNIHAAKDEGTPLITSEDWKTFNQHEREDFLQKYRVAYLSETMVNWCAAMGTVLSNDEVKDGVSERGGYPVERKKMLQWSMRISAYAERLLTGLDSIDWPEPLKEMQRNWIGKSVGCELDFELLNSKEKIRVFTTRIDTIYGVSFMVLAPEHELVEKITTDAQRAEVAKYVEVAKNRSERERMSEVKRISGVFTGAYVINPFDQQKVPVWIADYVLAGYGTGAVMAVPSSDSRDYAFAKHFNLPIINVLEGPKSDITKDNFDPKSGNVINSGFLNGLAWDKAIEIALKKVEALGIGERRINYRMRDAIFGRQRYWGEPFPVYFDNGIPKLVRTVDLPITLPEVDTYKPTESGEPPLGRAKDWKYRLTPNPSPEERGASTRNEEMGFSNKGSALEKAKEAAGERGRETADKKYWHILKQYSKSNRQNQTESESSLWEALRNNKIGYKIRRQHAIGIFIADFVCLDKRLVIEVDGAYHVNNAQYDIARTEFLKSEGFTLIRFTNHEVEKNLSKVITEIKAFLDDLPSIKSVTESIGDTGPLSSGEGWGEAFPFELTTMPGWAGSSWYWYRYMDPKNNNEFCSKEKESYWKDVDLYIGGSEHATGHLLYSRFWNKAMKDLGLVEADEPFRKLINQGHIQGVSKFVYRLGLTFDCSQKSIDKPLPEVFISKSLVDLISSEKLGDTQMAYIKNSFDQQLSLFNRENDSDFSPTFFRLSDIQPLHVDIKLVENDELDLARFRNWRSEYEYSIIIGDADNKYTCGSEIEKMSKSKYNVVNPDEMVEKYGADTLRMYEMFLGPLEQSKPWSTNGIDGVYKFLRRFWNLAHDNTGTFKVSEDEATRPELKVLHKTLKKIEHDIENFSFNTSVSELMICVNELSTLKCNKRSVIQPLVIALSPFAPHISEELWEKLGHNGTILKERFPQFDEQFIKENSFEYPISINGKVRAMMNFALDMPKEDIEKLVLASEIVTKWTEGKPPKKVIIVQGKIVNVVL